MSARRKLNSAHVNRTLLFAGALGLVTQSWLIFGAAFTGLLITSVSSGDIRLSQRPPRRKRKR